MTFIGGVLFQAVNPKAWLMAINVALMYTVNSNILTVMLGFMVLNLPCILIWAVMGDRLGKHLQVAWKLQLFNSLMALSLLATTLWMVVEAVQMA